MSRTIRSVVWGAVVGAGLIGVVLASEIRPLDVSLGEQAGSAPDGTKTAAPPPEAREPLHSLEPAGELRLLDSVEDSAEWNMEERAYFRCRWVEPDMWICGYGIERVPRARR